MISKRGRVRTGKKTERPAFLCSRLEKAGKKVLCMNRSRGVEWTSKTDEEEADWLFFFFFSQGMLFWLHFYSLISFSFPLFVTKQVCLSSDHILITRRGKDSSLVLLILLHHHWRKERKRLDSWSWKTHDDQNERKNERTRRWNGQKRRKTTERGSRIKEITVSSVWEFK